MPTAKDMGLAKQLIAKNMVSRAEMQRLLDELDDGRKAGRNISFEKHLMDNKVLTQNELDFLLGSKKRVVHCSKCKTMYRAQEEDIGKRFKCKKCGTFVIVPEPGRTEVRAVSEIRKEVAGEQKTPLLEIDTQKFVAEHANRQAAAKAVKPPSVKSEEKESERTILLGLEDEAEPEHDSSKADFRTSKEAEVTIMLDLDDEIDDDEEALIVEDDLGEQGGVFEPMVDEAEENSPQLPKRNWSIGDSEENSPLFMGEITPSFEEEKSLSNEEKKALSKWAEEDAPAKGPGGKEPEMTIMLDLDDDDEDDEDAS